MKTRYKLLFALLILTVLCTSAASAGFFDFLSGEQVRRVAQIDGELTDDARPALARRAAQTDRESIQDDVELGEATELYDRQLTAGDDARPGFFSRLLGRQRVAPETGMGPEESQFGQRDMSDMSAVQGFVFDLGGDPTQGTSGVDMEQMKNMILQNAGFWDWLLGSLDGSTMPNPGDGCDGNDCPDGYEPCGPKGCYCCSTGGDDDIVGDIVESYDYEGLMDFNEFVTVNIDQMSINNLKDLVLMQNYILANMAVNLQTLNDRVGITV
ncbi:MAG: hypothetical protein ABIF40_05770 [archaeon]